MSQEAIVRGNDAPGAKETPRRAGRRRRWEAADTVIAGSVLLVALIVGIFVALCFQGYNSTIENAKQRAQQAADVVAEGTRWSIGAAIAVLDGIAATTGGDTANAGSDTFATFQASAATIPAQLDFGVFDAEGRAIEDASSPNMPASVAGTDYFAAAAGGKAFAVGAKTMNDDGESRFFVARRLEVDGAFSGVAIIGIHGSGVLARTAEPQDLGEDSSISLIRSDGLMVARYPPVDEAIDVSGQPNFQQMLTNETGSYISGPSIIDGIVRIIAFRRAGDLGLIAIATISKETALAGLWYSIWIVSLLIAPIALALLVGSFVTANLLRRTQSTSRSLAAALAHNETLFREIHHRVKNNLQSINSLLQLHPIPREVRADMSQRIAAMSAVHEHIYRSNTFSQVRVKGYLHTLVENIRAGYGRDVELVEDIHDVAVEKDAATPLGLIVNEVVSNCFKHAFSDDRKGVVTVSLRAVGDGNAELTVRDNGVGFDPDSPAKGIGRRLVQGLAAQIQGEASQTNDNGSVFTLVFPLVQDRSAAD